MTPLDNNDQPQSLPEGLRSIIKCFTATWEYDRIVRYGMRAFTQHCFSTMAVLDALTLRIEVIFQEFSDSGAELEEMVDILQTGLKEVRPSLPHVEMEVVIDFWASCSYVESALLPTILDVIVDRHVISLYLSDPSDSPIKPSSHVQSSLRQIASGLRSLRLDNIQWLDQFPDCLSLPCIQDLQISFERHPFTQQDVNRCAKELLTLIEACGNALQAIELDIDIEEPWTLDSDASRDGMRPALRRLHTLKMSDAALRLFGIEMPFWQPSVLRVRVSSRAGWAMLERFAISPEANKHLRLLSINRDSLSGLLDQVDIGWHASYFAIDTAAQTSGFEMKLDAYFAERSALEMASKLSSVQSRLDRLHCAFCWNGQNSEGLAPGISGPIVLSQCRSALFDLRDASNASPAFADVLGVLRAPMLKTLSFNVRLSQSGYIDAVQQWMVGGACPALQAISGTFAYRNAFIEMDDNMLLAHRQAEARPRATFERICADRGIDLSELIWA